MELFGLYEYFKSAPQNYIITKFSPQTEFGSVGSITLIKVLNNGYSLAWNTQINSKLEPFQGFSIVSWFAPYWDTKNANNTVNFICNTVFYNNDDQTIFGDSYNYAIITNNTNDLVLPAENQSLIGNIQNISWPISVLQEFLFVDQSLSDGFYQYKCVGIRFLDLIDAQLKSVKYGDTFQFKVGYKVYRDFGKTPVIQSTGVVLNYSVVDSATFKYSFTNIQQPVASDASLSIMSLYQNKFGAADFNAGTPKNYSIEQFSNKTGTGLVVSITLVKVQGRGYALTWNTQVNYLTEWNEEGHRTVSWFSAAWDINPTNYVHSVCSHEYVAQIPLSDSKKQLEEVFEGNMVGKDLGMLDLEEDWPQEIVNETNYDSILVYPENTSNDTFYKTKCLGGRMLWWNETSLKILQYSQNFQFKAGFKFYKNYFDIITQSSFTQTAQNYTVVDTAVAAFSFTTAIVQNDAVHPGIYWQNSSSDIWGPQDYFIQTNARNYTVNEFSSKTGFGMSASIAIVKYPEGYGILWNTQANYKFNSYNYLLSKSSYPQYDYSEDPRDILINLWFTPSWDANNSTNLNFQCTQKIRANQWNEAANSTSLVSSSTTKYFRTPIGTDMNQLISVDMDQDQKFNISELNIKNIWQQGIDETVIIGTNISTAGCVGHRLLFQNDSALKSLKYGDTFSFRAGYKINDNYQFLAQSYPSVQPFNFTIVDTALATANWATNILQPNASDALQSFKSIATLLYGSQAYFDGKPANYFINNYSNKTQSGATAAITLAKYPDGYGLFWSVQLNTKILLPNGTNFYVFFSPRWFTGVNATTVNNTYAHHVCQYRPTDYNQDLDAWNLSSNNTFVITSTNDLNTFVESEYDMYETNSFDQNSNFSPKYLWMNTYTAQNQGFFTVGCQGNRLLQQSDLTYRPLKYGDTFTFRAGYKIFDYNMDIILQSYANVSNFNYTVVDTVLASTSFNTSIKQATAVDPFPFFQPYMEILVGKQDMKSAVPQNFTKNSFSQITNFGLTAAITLVKTTDTYNILWNVQLNSNFAFGDGFLTQLWFSPQWMALNSTNSVVPFANFICENKVNNLTLNNGSWTLQNFWQYYQTTTNYDINILAQSPWDIYEQAVKQNFKNIWMQGMNQTFSMNKTQLSVSCMGSRSLLYFDNQFRQLRYGDTFSFRAGYKVWNLNKLSPVCQSTLGNLTNYIILDSALANFQFPNMTQINPTDLTMTFRSYDLLTFGARDYILNSPRFYVVNPMSNYTRTGLVAATQLAKFPDGYAFLWAVSVNTNDQIGNNTVIQTWFTPNWNLGQNATAPGKDVNLFCQYGTLNGTPYNFTGSYTGPNDLSDPVQTPDQTLGNQFTQSANNAAIWATGQISVLQANATTSQPAKYMYQTSCQGVRYLQYFDSAFKTLKYGDSFSFKSGYKIFNSAAIAVQSYANNQTNYNVTIVDTALASTFPIQVISQPTAFEPFIKYLNPILTQSKGKLDYRIGGVRNFVVNDFSNKTGYGLTATVSMARIFFGTPSYTLNWNVQANYKQRLGAGMMSQIWFAPNWALNNPNNATGNFTNLNFVCEQFIPADPSSNTASSNLGLYSGPYELNLPSDSFTDTYSQQKKIDLNDLQLSWFTTMEFNTSSGSNATNTSAAAQQSSASGCWGVKYLFSQDTQFRNLKLGDTFSFRAGFKIWNNTQIIAQSWTTNNTFNYTMVDSALQSNYSFIQPNANDSWVVYFPLLNQTKGVPCLNTSNPCPASTTTNVTANNTPGASFFYKKGTSQNYTIMPFSNVTNYGVVSTLNLIKYTAGYGMTWNIQINYKQSLLNGTVIQIVFSPVWGAVGDYVNYMCQDDIRATTSNANSAKQTQNLSHKLNYFIGNSFTSNTGQYTTFQNTTQNWANLWSFNDTWIQTLIQNNTPDSKGFFYTSCMGAKPLYINDTRLKTIKYADTIQFTAGFAVFQRDAADGQGQSNSIVIQGWPQQQLFIYTVVDSALKNGQESCDLLDNDGNCIYNSDNSDEMNSDVDQVYENNGFFRL